MMFTKIAAGTLFVTFIVFVNLAAALTASFNRVETSAIASIAGIFGLLVDIGAIILVGYILIRWFMKLAWQSEVRAQKAVYRQPSKTAAPANSASWHYATPEPLPFENQAAVSYSETVNVPLSQGFQTNNVHRMHPTREGYRMVR